MRVHFGAPCCCDWIPGSFERVFDEWLSAEFEHEFEQTPLHCRDVDIDFIAVLEIEIHEVPEGIFNRRSFGPSKQLSSFKGSEVIVKELGSFFDRNSETTASHARVCTSLSVCEWLLFGRFFVFEKE